MFSRFAQFLKHKHTAIKGAFVGLLCLLFIVPSSAYAFGLGAIPVSDGTLDALKNLQCQKTTGFFSCLTAAGAGSLVNLDFSGIGISAAIKALEGVIQGMVTSAFSGATSYDGIARLTATALLQSNVNHIIGKIQSGIGGQPAFVQNLAEHLIKTARTAVGGVETTIGNTTTCNFYNFTSSNGSLFSGFNLPNVNIHLPKWSFDVSGFNLPNIPNPFKGDLLGSLSNAFSWLHSTTTSDIANAVECTIGGAANAAGVVFANLDAGGGWDQWDQIASHPSNSPIGLAMVSQQQAARAASIKKTEETTQLGYNNGYQSLTKNGQVTTPGSVLSAQLNDALNNGGQLSTSGVHTISDLVSQMIAQALANEINNLAGGASGSNYSISHFAPGKWF